MMNTNVFGLTSLETVYKVLENCERYVEDGVRTIKFKDDAGRSHVFDELGNFRHSKSGKVLSNKSRRGSQYLIMNIPLVVGDRANTVTVYRHALVWGAFHMNELAQVVKSGSSGDFVVNHKNGRKTDNSLSNLELCSCADNVWHGSVLNALIEKKLAPVETYEDKVGVKRKYLKHGFSVEQLKSLTNMLGRKVMSCKDSDLIKVASMFCF